MRNPILKDVKQFLQRLSVWDAAGVPGRSVWLQSSFPSPLSYTAFPGERVGIFKRQHCRVDVLPPYPSHWHLENSWLSFKDWLKCGCSGGGFWRTQVHSGSWRCVGHPTQSNWCRGNNQFLLEGIVLRFKLGSGKNVLFSKASLQLERKMTHHLSLIPVFPPALGPNLDPGFPH